MLLLIPGPVTTHPDTRAAMARDYAPWDNEFRALYASIQARLNALAGGLPGVHAALPVQGCGHFATEAALRAFVKPGDEILIPQTGQYATRMARLAEAAGRRVVSLAMSQTAPLDPAHLASALAAHPSISHVGLIYSETSTGIVNDPVKLGATVRAAGRHLILDAVSAFGALPLDLAAQPEIDAAIFTINKCLEAPPGLAFVLTRLDRLRACAGFAGGWSLDLTDILAVSERAPGASRFTPAAPAIAALGVALDLLDVETRPGRLARYTANMNTLLDGVIALGLRPCLERAVQGPIVVNVEAPRVPAWDLQGFVDALKSRGFLISNFYDTPEPSFRVGCIGGITPRDMQNAVTAMGEALDAIGVSLAVAA